jgi:hypothetical protein
MVLNLLYDFGAIAGLTAYCLTASPKLFLRQARAHFVQTAAQRTVVDGISNAGDCSTQ